MLRSESQSKPEERFVELFQEVFGPAAVAKLEMQRPFQDIAGGTRFIDFALDSLLDRYALEIDGETYHHPAALTSEQYEDQLLRQNSLIHQGWRVLRWTDRQLAHKSETVKEQLSLLLDEAIRLCIPADYLPVKRGAVVPLWEHQQEALDSLEAMRERGVQIAFLYHAVATGKTTSAIEDARRFGKRTLFLAHTHELVAQALDRFGKLWPEATRAELGKSGEAGAQVVVGTVQFMAKNLARYGAKDFAYLVVDEAHHATSNSYRAVLRYFDPDFLLGLTGTPERADGQNALEVFQETAHRMDMESAVKAGVLCDVRCFRVETNVDLKRLRFNGNLYNQKDLEDRVSIPARNELIVQTYAENVPHRPTVCFCVSVAHAEKMAALFGEAGFSSQAVSGRQSKEERAAILARFSKREIEVLCACDVLNEGWDAPQIEVLLMARPTLSKVIYQQQLGRGMRSAPGKRFLVLFDFVDAFGRHNQALSIHRWLKRPEYRAGSRLFEPEKDAGETVLEVPLHLWARDLVPINVFDWQETVEGMLTASHLSRKLRKSDEWANDLWKCGDLLADEVIELGDDRHIPYFLPKREAELRQKYGIPEVTPDTLWADFLKNVGDMKMTRSYKPVFLLAVLKHSDEAGRAKTADVVEEFWRFYRDRHASGQASEHGTSRFCAPESLSLAEVQALVNRHPFSRFERLDYLAYASDRAFFEWSKPIWKRLSQPENRAEVEFLAQRSLDAYFAREG